jgi:hypothetical protein
MANAPARTTENVQIDCYCSNSDFFLKKLKALRKGRRFSDKKQESSPMRYLKALKEQTSA